MDDTTPPPAESGAPELIQDAAPVEAPSLPAEALETPVESTPASTAQMPAIEPLSEPLPAPEMAPPAAPATPPPTPSHTAAPQPPVSTPATNLPRELLATANLKKKVSKEEKLEKIMTALAKTGRITNDDVQALLKCSDATATRYLAELVRRGRIKKVGTTGAHVVYVLS